jgi:hypothetical protein
MLQKHADMLRTLQRLLSIPGVATGPAPGIEPAHYSSGFHFGHLMIY